MDARLHLQRARVEDMKLRVSGNEESYELNALPFIELMQTAK